MATKLQIYNLALLRLGEELLTADDEDTNPADVCNAIYSLVLDEVLSMGPEKGWKFATRRYSGIDRDEITIASIANSSTSGDITITGTHSLVVGDLVTLIDDTGYDDTYAVTAISTTTTFDVTATFVATGTGTAYWTSEKYAYRYAKPSGNEVVFVSVGGVELADWIREGQWILTNMEDGEVDMEYIQLGTALTVGNFPPHFVKVLYMNLAVHLAYDLVQSRALQEDLKIELENIHIPRAIGMDAKEQYVKEEDNSWQEAGH